MGQMRIFLALLFLCQCVQGAAHFRWFLGKFIPGRTEEISYDEQKLPGVLKYNTAAREQSANYNLAVLGVCKKVAFEFADADFAQEQKSKSTILDSLLKKLLTSTPVAEVALIEASLDSHFCRSALENSFLSPETIELMAQKIPSYVNAHQLSQIRDFSFLLPSEIQGLFACENGIRKPFHLEAFWTTAKAEVVAETLKHFVFDFDGDSTALLNYISWISRNTQLRDELESDPLYWFMQRQLISVPIPFPFEQLMKDLTDAQNFKKLIPLLLAFSHLNSERLTLAMQAIIHAHADLHKNDHIEEFGLSESQVRAREVRQFNLWLEICKPHFEVIKVALIERNRLMEKLKVVYSHVAHLGAALTLPIEHLLTLLAGPHGLLARESFSVELEEFVAAYEADGFTQQPLRNEPYLFPEPEMINNLQMWTFMWKQVDVLLDDQSGSMRSYGSLPKTAVARNLIVAWRSVCNASNTSMLTSSWSTKFALSLLHAKESEPAYSLLMSEVTKVLLHSKLTVHDVSLLQATLGHINEISSIVAAHQNELIKKFLTNPVSLSRSEILFMLRDETGRFYLYKHFHCTRQLRTLVDFEVDDLNACVGGLREIESFEALYTLRPTVIAQYLQRNSPVALNHPAKFLWSLNPCIFQDDTVRWSLFEYIPVSVFGEYPREAERLELDHLATGIGAKLERISAEDAISTAIKWIINMDWNDVYLFGLEHNSKTSTWQNVVGAYSTKEARQRRALLTRLKKLGPDGQLMAKIAQLPISNLRFCRTFRLQMASKILGISKEAEFSSFEFAKSYDWHIEKIKENVANLQELIRRHIPDEVTRKLYENRLKFIRISGPMIGELNPLPLTFAREIICRGLMPAYDTALIELFLKGWGFDLDSLNELDEVPPGLNLERPARQIQRAAQFAAQKREQLEKIHKKFNNLNSKK